MAMFQGPGPYEKLASERVVVSAPMSFAGSTQRIVRGTEAWHPLIRVPLLIVVLPVVWMLILSWYLIWGLWLVPYRLIRRGSRKRKLQALQHREMLNQMQFQAIATQTALAQQLAAQQPGAPHLQTKPLPSVEPPPAPPAIDGPSS